MHVLFFLEPLPLAFTGKIKQVVMNLSGGLIKSETEMRGKLDTARPLSGELIHTELDDRPAYTRSR